MLIPKSGEYALRCMAQIAIVPQETAITAEQLHELVGVPRDYLSKILRKLVAAKLLISGKGKGGGFRLSQPPSKISFLRILQAVGYTIKPDHCAFGWGDCNSKNPCPLHETFTELNSHFITWASNTTLAEVNQTSEMKCRMGKLIILKS